MVDVMRAYEKLKDDRFRIDMEDVLMLAAGMMEAEPSVAMNVQERYNFFVVDEYQDVSPLQQQLLELWLGDRDDLCVVGDASQTIYSFTGASSDYLLDFGTRYPEAELVKLETNYRSTASIVRSANELMRSQPGALDLHAVEETGGIQPDLTEYPTDAAEARSIASRSSAVLVSTIPASWLTADPSLSAARCSRGARIARRTRRTRTCDRRRT
jgi:DNA helicase-2/ATP-dependent DNA helicase PcrA